MPPKKPKAPIQSYEQPTLIVSKEGAEKAIGEQIQKGEEFLSRKISNEQEQRELSNEVDRWVDFNTQLIGKLFSNPSEKESYDSKRRVAVSFSYMSATPLHELVDNENKQIHRSLNLLHSLKERLPLFDSIDSGEQKKDEQEVDPLVVLGKIFQRFHRFSRQLRVRHQNRPTIEVEDEYDVQDLLHALLRIEFEDIRPEEWTPSYAGKSARTDFLLKDEKIVIEVKKTRKNLTEKELGDELIVDIERYQVHPDCKSLVCFVYDPEGKIGNPAGLTNDLENRYRDIIPLRVFIYPAE